MGEREGGGHAVNDHGQESNPLRVPQRPRKTSRPSDVFLCQGVIILVMTTHTLIVMTVVIMITETYVDFNVKKILKEKKKH